MTPEGGKVEQAGAPWDIYYRPRTAFLADFVGAVNLVPAKVLDVADDAVTIAFGSQRASVRRPKDVTLGAGQEVKLCLRPESFTIGSMTANSTGGQGIELSGTIVRRAFLGDTMRYWVKVDDREWIVDQPDLVGAPRSTERCRCRFARTESTSSPRRIRARPRSGSRPRCARARAPKDGRASRRRGG